MLLWLLLVLATDGMFAAADPLDVAKLTVRQNEWITPGEVAWWMEDGRYLILDPWLCDRGLLPGWKYRLWFGVLTPLDEAVTGTFNGLRIEQLNREQRELKDAVAAAMRP